MGKLNSVSEKKATLCWAKEYLSSETHLSICTDYQSLAESFEYPLKKYFALTALARGKNSDQELLHAACKLLFPIRVKIEQEIIDSIGKNCDKNFSEWIFNGSFFGHSKKQNISVRLPLTSCQPTELCSSSCYAHDALDAAPRSVIRGAINGAIASAYENDLIDRQYIMKKLTVHIEKAVKSALKEQRDIQKKFNWMRPAYIRFSHVGELSNFPDFANSLAENVIWLSEGKVFSTIYTRHKKVNKLNPDLWIINFTLDRSSMNRKIWIPTHARTVFSAFDGVINRDAEINFLEHHRWSHVQPKGVGACCPATLPETPIKTCDAVQCCLCFQRPISK